MFVRRRPLLRAAAVGGGAYMAGRAAGRRAEDRQYAESEQDARIASLEQQPYQRAQQPYQQAPPPPPPAAAAPSVSEQLNQLSALHEQGALTDDEFTAAKARLLGG